MVEIIALPQQECTMNSSSSHDVSSEECITFSQHYRVENELGSGSFAVVYGVTHKRKKRSFAAKVIDTHDLSDKEMEHLENELEILSDLRHPNIVRLCDIFYEEECCYIVTEKLLGGELFDRILDRVSYDESSARDLGTSLFSAVQYMHDRKIVHRDLKPENLLLVSQESDTLVKIADFGFAKKCPAPESLVTVCGTPGYKPPEMYRNKAYGTEVDCWACGVIIYILLGGYTPFDETDGATRRAQVCGGVYEFHEEYWGDISSDAIDLIRGLLTVKQKHRLTAREALAHPWIGASSKSLGGFSQGGKLAVNVMATHFEVPSRRENREHIRNIPIPAAA